MLKYVHALLCTAQCDSVDTQSCACSAGIFLIDGVGGPRCPLSLDKDTVCAPPPGSLCGGLHPSGLTCRLGEGRVGVGTVLFKTVQHPSLTCLT